jgi:hypothetical protein
MNEAIYIEMPVPANIRNPICTKQDCKDYGPQIIFVGIIFVGVFIGLIYFLVHQ